MTYLKFRSSDRIGLGSFAWIITRVMELNKRGRGRNNKQNQRKKNQMQYIKTKVIKCMSAIWWHVKVQEKHKVPRLLLLGCYTPPGWFFSTWLVCAEVCLMVAPKSPGDFGAKSRLETCLHISCTCSYIFQTIITLPISFAFLICTT